MLPGADLRIILVEQWRCYLMFEENREKYICSENLKSKWVCWNAGQGGLLCITDISKTLHKQENQ